MPKVEVRREKARSRKGALAIAGAIVAVMAVTLGVAGKGLFLAFDDPAVGEARKSEHPRVPAKPARLASPAKAAPTGKRDEGARQAVARQAAEQFKVKRVLPINGPFRHGDYVWDDAGVPAGPVVITIDLKAQTLSVFRGGYEIGAAVILYGATDKPSPLGVFPIMEKDADHVSSLYDNAPMPYSLRLTGDGVFIHGSDVQWGNATHGCIGIPTPFAKKLFGVAKIGDIAIITNGKMMAAG